MGLFCDDGRNTVSERIFLGRQPIFDRVRNVIGYELLYRDGFANFANFQDADEATRQVASNALVEMGIDQLTSGGLAFINVTRSFLLEGLYRALPSHRVVLELLEDEQVDELLLDKLKELQKEGYRFALDDFSLNSLHDELIERSAIVKIDLPLCPPKELSGLVDRLKARGALLLAEKVETPEDFAICHALGFDLFQGYFFTRPQVLSSHRITSNRLSVLQLLAELSSPSSDVEHLGEIINQDIGLTYRTLRLANSGFFSLPKQVQDIREALVMLGINAVNNLAVLIAFTTIDDKPNELTTLALVRAKMSEKLAEQLNLDCRAAFTVGMLSVLDALLDSPMATVVEQLPLTPDIRAALVHKKGPLGVLLDAVVGYERGEPEKADQLEVPSELTARSYVQSVVWAEDLCANVVTV